MRLASAVAGVALVVLAFAAAGRVTDTRDGLIAEVITLLSGLAGIGLVTYAFAARPRARPASSPPEQMPARSAAARARATRDLVLGAAGVLLAIVLLTGLAVSAGPLWAILGLALLLPMIAGSIYLCVRFLRANP